MLWSFSLDSLMRMEGWYSPVGMNVKAQSFYAELRDIVKSSFSCAVGSMMSNRIPDRGSVQPV